jgi:hypothetical protein
MKLRGIHKSIIKSAYAKNLAQIKNILYHEKVDDGDLKSTYQFLWENKTNCFQDFDILINNIMKGCLFLIKKEENSEKRGNLLNGMDIYNNLLISDSRLKTRVYLLKLFSIIYNTLFDIKEIKITELKEDKKAKDVIISNINKLLTNDNR